MFALGCELNLALGSHYSADYWNSFQLPKYKHVLTNLMCQGSKISSASCRCLTGPMGNLCPAGGHADNPAHLNDSRYPHLSNWSQPSLSVAHHGSLGTQLTSAHGFRSLNPKLDPSGLPFSVPPSCSLVMQQCSGLPCCYLCRLNLFKFA